MVSLSSLALLGGIHLYTLFTMWQAVVLGVASGVFAGLSCFLLHIALNKCSCGSEREIEHGRESIRKQYQRAPCFSNASSCCSHEYMVNGMESGRLSSVGSAGRLGSVGSCGAMSGRLGSVGSVGAMLYRDADGRSEHDDNTESTSDGNQSHVTPEPPSSDKTSLEESEWDCGHSGSSSPVMYGRLLMTSSYDSHTQKFSICTHKVQTPKLQYDPLSYYVSVRVEECSSEEAEPVCHSHQDIQLTETLIIDASPTLVATSCMRLSLYRKQEDGPWSLEGCNQIEMSSIAFESPHTAWYYLKPNPYTQVCANGMLQVSLCYLTSTQCLSVMLVRACNLAKQTPNVRVVVLLRNGERLIKSKASSIKRGCNSPEWNEVLMFHVPEDILSQLTLQLVVMDTEKTPESEVLGVAWLGDGQSGVAGAHWRLMLQEMTQPIAMWHFLTKI